MSTNLTVATLMEQLNVKSEYELQQMLKKAYYEGNPLITDSEYDSLFPSDPIGYQLENNTAWSKFEHLISSEPMTKYKRLQDAIDAIKLNQIDVEVIEHKLDGINITLYYDNGILQNVVTRGSGIEGEDVYSNGIDFKGVKHSINLFDKVAIRGELVMSNTDFNAIQDANYSNRRNSTAGIARRLDGRFANLLTFNAYELHKINPDGTSYRYPTIEAREQLIELGFIVPEDLTNKYSSLEDIYNAFASTRDNYEAYPHDGLVIKYGQNQFALKYEANTCSTKITGYTWKLGGTSRLVPVAHFEPVVIGGATLTKASIASARNYMEINAPVGSTVEIARANEVIPYLKSVLERPADSELEVPSQCPVCGELLHWSGAHLVCVNEDCGHRLIAKCDRIVKALDVPRFTTELVTSLIYNGSIKSSADVFKVKPLDLEAIGTSPQQALKLVNSLHEGISRLSDCDIIYCLNIPKLSINNIIALEDAAIEKGQTLLSVIEAKDDELFMQVLKRAKTLELMNYLNAKFEEYLAVKDAILSFRATSN